MYPAQKSERSKSDSYSLQGTLFGHRMRPNQTKYEYLIEFLQVALADKKDSRSLVRREGMFPIHPDIANNNLTYMPKVRMGLKRFMFLPKGKLDGRAEVDKQAYEECLKMLEDKINGGTLSKRRNSLHILQTLLNSFSAVYQNRAWFAQNSLPICPEVISPEGMGTKAERKKFGFSIDDPRVDNKFDFLQYTYMCRGGEIYYLHLLNALNEYPELCDSIQDYLYQMITSFPAFSHLCNFIQESWDEYMDIDDCNKPSPEKHLGAIPLGYSQRNKHTLQELSNFLSSNCHPFEKMEIFSNGMILQILCMAYRIAATEKSYNCWVIDVNSPDYPNPEMKKIAQNAFRKNDEAMSNYLYNGLLEWSMENQEKDEAEVIRKAADDSYLLYRKLGKSIGIIIPNTGVGTRFTLSEDVIQFLVLSIIPPTKMITLDTFMRSLYDHFGMIIGPEEYKSEVAKGRYEQLQDLSCFEENKKAFSQKLKDCGFLRDLSDATSIVENPYECEVIRS